MPSSTVIHQQLQETIRTAVVEARKAGVVVPHPEEDDPVELLARAATLEQQVSFETSLARDAEEILKELGNYHRPEGNGDAAAAGLEQQPELSPQQRELETEQLEIKVQVLEVCSAARSLLDQSISVLEASSSSSATPRTSNHEDETNHDTTCDGSALDQASQLYFEAKESVSKGKAILQQYQEESPIHDDDSPILSPVATLLHSLHTCLVRHEKDLMATAHTLWKQNVTVTATSLGCRSTFAVSAVLVVLQALGGDDDEDDMPAAELVQVWMKEQLCPHILQPLCDSFQVDGTSSTQVSTMYQVIQDEADDEQCRFEWKTTTSSAPADVVPRWESALDFLHKLFAFVVKHILCETKELVEVARTSLIGSPGGDGDDVDTRKGWDMLDVTKLGLESNLLVRDESYGLFLEPLLRALERSCIPQQHAVDRIETLQARADHLQPVIDTFVKALHTVFDVDLDTMPKLSTFPASMIETYAANRQSFHLEQARRVLVETTDYHTTVRVGEEVPTNETTLPLLTFSNDNTNTPKFPLPPMGISSTAFQLQSYTRSVLDEAAELAASETSDAVVAMLCQTARRVMDLFRAVIPIVRGREVATIPQVAAILYNDGIYLANVCMTIGLEYRERFENGFNVETEATPGDKRQSARCMMVDMAPKFLHMADTSLLRMLGVQKQQVKTLVMERTSLLGQALRSNEPLAEWSDAETAVDASIYHLQHLHHAWNPVLPQDVLQQCIGRLADTMLSSFLDPILQAKDISAEATQFIHRLLLQRALRNLAPLTGPPHATQWDVCEAVGRFMDMTLVDVHAGLTQHRTLQSLRASEIQRLLQACFDDSQQRRNLIQLLARQPN